jgi:hypothetical protein
MPNLLRCWEWFGGYRVTRFAPQPYSILLGSCFSYCRFPGHHGAMRPLQDPKTVRTNCLIDALIGAEGEPFFFEIDFYIFELIENVLTQNAVDFSLNCAREIFGIHNQNPFIFQDCSSDG